MMKPKELRDRLFKKDRPFIRPLEIYDGDSYHKDMGILWAAHQKKSFYGYNDVTQEEFAKQVEELSQDKELYMIEDHNKGYKDHGPVGAIAVETDGWKIEPHAEFFKWATPKNILRASVSFLQMARYKKIGCVEVRCVDSSKSLFDHCVNYGVLYFSGKILGGDPRGTEYIYSVRGRKNVNRTIEV